MYGLIIGGGRRRTSIVSERFPHSAQWHVIRRSAPFRQYRRPIYDPSGLERRDVKLLVIVLLIVSREVINAVVHQSGKNKSGTKSKTVSPLKSGVRGKEWYPLR